MILDSTIAVHHQPHLDGSRSEGESPSGPIAEFAAIALAVGPQVSQPLAKSTTPATTKETDVVQELRPPSSVPQGNNLPRWAWIFHPDHDTLKAKGRQTMEGTNAASHEEILGLDSATIQNL
jgi:hypothetical protein